MKPGLFLLTLGTVLLLHWAALHWLSDLAQHPGSPVPLAQLAAPMFTRNVEQTKAPAPPPARIAAKPKPGKVATALRATVPNTAINTSSASTGSETDADAAAQASPAVPDNGAAAEPKPQMADANARVESAIEVPRAEPSPPKDAWPPDTRLTYRLTGNYRGELNGSARVQWQQIPAPQVTATQGSIQARGYQVRLEMSLSSFVVVSMTSQGQLSDDGLQPQVYEEKLPGNVRRVAFDDAQIRFNNGRVDVRPTTVQDTASQFVELSQRFASGRESLKAGAEVRLWLARPGGLDFWTYDVLAPEILQTPELGAIEAFHLKPRPLANPRGPIVADMWFAPSLQFLPVRVRISLGGDNFVDLMVERIEQGDAAPAAAPKQSKPSQPT